MNRLHLITVTALGMFLTGSVEAKDVAFFWNEKGGESFEREIVGVRQDDGGTRYTIPRAEAAKWDFAQIKLERGQATKGESGFWLFGRGILGNFTRDSVNCTQTAHVYMNHPYIAMQNPRGAFIAIVDGMRFEADAVVKAKQGKYLIRPVWRLKNYVFNDPYEDLSMVVYDLPAGSDYNAMAKAYRDRIVARESRTRPVLTFRERAKKHPHLLAMADSIALRTRHACKPYTFGDPKLNRDLVGPDEKAPKCGISFAETLAFMRKLKGMGIDRVAFCSAGWQDGGYDGRSPSSFPVNDAAGGEAELRKMIRGIQDLGYIVDGHSNYTDCYACSPMWNDGEVAARDPDGKVSCHGAAFAGGRSYHLCLKHAWDTYLPAELERISKLGYYGAHYIDVFTAIAPFPCWSPKHKANRREIAEIQLKVAQRCQELFGGFSSECDLDHLIGLVDYVNYTARRLKDAPPPIKGGKDCGYDRIVPFTEIAFHDYRLANPDKSTQEYPEGDNWLDLVEFGGRPIVYNFKANDEHAKKIADLFFRFKPLRHLQGVEMLEHREIKPGFVRVSYAGGDKLYVNHTKTTQEADGVRVDAASYKLVKGN